MCVQVVVPRDLRLVGESGLDGEGPQRMSARCSVECHQLIAFESKRTDQ
jgi:hypothetical protein